MKKICFVIFVLLLVGESYADVVCESDETLVNGSCVPVCDNTTINFEYDGTCIKNKFQVTTTDDTNEFAFYIGASGTFYIDWGDGIVEKYTRSSTGIALYSHTYSTTQSYTIGFGGQGTGYCGKAAAECAAIIFGLPEGGQDKTTRLKVATVSGSLSKLFPNVSYLPKFLYLFRYCSNLTSVPENLFSGLNTNGFMFHMAFQGTGLTSIPQNLFNGLHGNMQRNMFYQTFVNCTGLTSIPSNLFANLSGTPATQMMKSMFSGCSNITGFTDENGNTTTYIPPTFFANISNTNYSSGPMSGIFGGTKISTSCPKNMYQYITGFEVDLSNKVSCVPCPDGLVSPAGSTDVSQCVEPTISINWYNEDTLVSTTTCIVNGELELPPEPTRPGYTFAGWRVRENNNNE